MEIEKGNRRCVSLSAGSKSSPWSEPMSCWRISRRIGLMLGGRPSLLVSCQSTSENLPSTTKKLDKWLSEVQNHMFMLYLSDFLLISTNRLKLHSWPLGTAWNWFRLWCRQYGDELHWPTWSPVRMGGWSHWSFVHKFSNGNWQGWVRRISVISETNWVTL